MGDAPWWARRGRRVVVVGGIGPADGPGAGTAGLVAWLSVVQGVVNAFDIPARQALLVTLVARREDLPNAVALNSSLVNGSRLVGPSVAGAVIAAAGEAWCFVIDAVSYLAVVAALLAMRLPERGRPPAAGSVGRHLVEGVRYAFGFPPIRALLLLLAVVGFAAVPYSVLLPVFAADELGGGPHALGLLTAASGLGALSGALYLASRASVLGLGRVIVAATVTLDLALVGFSRSGSLALSAALLVFAGAGMMVQMAAANTLIQTMVDDDKRGRVMGLFGMAFQGSAPFGGLLAGWLAGSVGVHAVVTRRERSSSSAGWRSRPSYPGCGGTPCRCTPGSASCRRSRPGRTPPPNSLRDRGPDGPHRRHGAWSLL